MKETSHCERKRLRRVIKRPALKKAIEAGEELTYKASLDKIRLSQAAFDTANVALACSYLEQVPPKLRRWEWYYLQKQFEGGIFALSGHADSVKRVCYSPDGTRIVTASGPVDMMSVRVWDARRGVSLFDLNGPLRGGSSVCFSPDGTRIATGSKEGTKVWDAKTGTLILELQDKRIAVTDLCYSPDGTRIVTVTANIVGGKPTGKVWDAKTGSLLLVLEGHTNFVASVCYSLDGTRIVTGSWDKTVKVWDAKTGRTSARSQGHSRCNIDRCDQS